VLRLEAGASGLSSGWYCKERATTGVAGHCDDLGRLAFWPTMVRGEVDLPLARALTLAVGGAVASGPYYDRSATFLEPTADFRVHAQVVDAWSTRAYLGLGVPVSDGGNVGAEARVGLGTSYLFSPSWGMAFDLVLSAGTYRGFVVGGASVAVGPELRL
jgi:hypothetical protein